MYLNELQQAELKRKALYSRDSNTGFHWNIINFEKADVNTDFMLLTGSCGRGKTTFALDLSENGLLYQVNQVRCRNSLTAVEPIKAEEVLFLVSRLNIKRQQLKKKNVILATESDYSGNLDFIQQEERKDKIKIATAHSFGSWVKAGKVAVAPKLIIIDELHSIYAETIFAESLYYTIAYVEEHKEIIKVGMTATPQFLYEYIQKYEKTAFVSLDICDLGSKYKAENVKTLIGGSAITLLKQLNLSNSQKVLVYLNSARECYQMAQEYGRNGAFIVSQYNFTNIDGKPLSAIMREQVFDGLDICEYIAERECFPDNVNVLFINSASREGINIKDANVKTVICEAVDMITIEQILGRMRQDLQNFYVVFNKRTKAMNDKNIREFQAFFKDYAENGEIALARQYGKQEQAQADKKPIQNLVVCYKGKYQINNFAKAYLQYLEECYTQLSNYESNYTKQVGERQLLLQIDYLNQLSKYAENGKIDVSYLWDEAIATNKANSIEKFNTIEHKYLYKQLGKAEKAQLVAELAMMRQASKKASWPTVKRELEESGYKITDKRVGKNKVSVSIISKL